MPTKVRVTWADVLDALRWLAESDRPGGRFAKPEPTLRRIAILRACDMHLAGAYSGWAEILPAGRAALALVEAIGCGGLETEVVVPGDPE